MFVLIFQKFDVLIFKSQLQESVIFNIFCHKNMHLDTQKLCAGMHVFMKCSSLCRYACVLKSLGQLCCPCALVSNYMMLWLAWTGNLS